MNDEDFNEFLNSLVIEDDDPVTLPRWVVNKLFEWIPEQDRAGFFAILFAEMNQRSIERPEIKKELDE